MEDEKIKQIEEEREQEKEKWRKISEENERKFNDRLQQLKLRWSGDTSTVAKKEYTKNPNPYLTKCFFCCNPPLEDEWVCDTCMDKWQQMCINFKQFFGGLKWK